MADKNVLDEVCKMYDGGPLAYVGKPMTELEKFVPLWSYCLVKVIPKTKTSGGLALPDGVKIDGTQSSRVIKAGPGEHRTCDGIWVENPIKEGDYIYHLSRGSLTPIVLDGEQYLYVSGIDVIARQIRE